MVYSHNVKMLLITKERKETLQGKEPEGSFGFSEGFWPHRVACGIEPVPPSIGRGSLNHWTTGKVLGRQFFDHQ